MDTDDLASWGVDSETLVKESKKQTIELWKQHETVVDLFSRCFSQLRVGAMGGVMGLDYVAVEQVAKWLGIRFDRNLLVHLQAMESEMISFFSTKGA